MSWHLACPRGHRALELGRDRFWCNTCKYHDLAAAFDKSELVDLRREEPPGVEGGAP